MSILPLCSRFPRRLASVFRLRRLAPSLWLWAILALPPVATLHAQAPPTKIFVASYGNDANDGSRGSPKRNFQAAHNAVGPGGQIVVLDTAGYGALTIDRSLEITVPPGVNGFVTVTGSNSGIIINITPGSGSVVSLRGLIIEGGATYGAGGVGVSAMNVGSLRMEDCTVRNFDAGVVFAPGNFGKSYLFNTTLRRCATGLSVGATGSFATSGTVSGCRFEENNSNGLVAFLASGSSGSAKVDVTVADSVFSGNSTGISTQSAGSVIVRVSNCTITDNSAGVQAVVGSQLLSRSNNTLENNPAIGVFTGNYTAK